MMKFSLLLLLLTASADAYQLQSNPQQRQQASIHQFGNRRDLFRAVAGATFVGASSGLLLSSYSPVANAIVACPTGSNNCIRTTWTPPAGTSKKDAAQQIKAVLESYPQEGQEKVDLGGWSFASDSLESSGTASLEYKSGIGNFAKFFNGGKPFIDDLVIEVGDNGITEVRSSSRVGDSDFNVNQKRLQYFVKKLNDLGWTAPDPTY